MVPTIPSGSSGMRFVRTCEMNTDIFRQDSDLECDQNILQIFFFTNSFEVRCVCTKGEAFVHGENQATAEFRGIFQHALKS